MTAIALGFVPESIMMSPALLLPSKRLPEGLENSPKYRTIEASILDVGIIEPLSVSRREEATGTRIMLDGHVRLQILRKLNYDMVPCLESIDDETYTYNSRVNRLSSIQEHFMLRLAIERGVSPERLARALNVNPEQLRRKVTLLDGICPEAAELLKDRQFSPILSGVLKKMKPSRQIECVEMMISTNTFTVGYARGLLFATPASHLEVGKKPRPIPGISVEQISRMEQEAANLQERYKSVEKDYGENVLHLTVVSAYLSKLLTNSEVHRYMVRSRPEVVDQLKAIVQSTSM